MDLLKRRRDDLDWNDWLMMPRWFDWTDSLRRMPTDALRVEEFERGVGDEVAQVLARLPRLERVALDHDVGVLAREVLPLAYEADHFAGCILHRQTFRQAAFIKNGQAVREIE